MRPVDPILNQMGQAHTCASNFFKTQFNFPIVKPDAQYLKFILFWNNTLHVSDGLSVHHQESTTVHTASGICHTGPVAAC